MVKKQKERKPGTCTRCWRKLKEIHVVNGQPYGPICVKKINDPMKQMVERPKVSNPDDFVSLKKWL